MRFIINHAEPLPADYLKSKCLKLYCGDAVISGLGGTVANSYGLAALGIGVPSRFRSPRLAPPPFANSVLNSFRGSFVRILKPWIGHFLARLASIFTEVDRMSCASHEQPYCNDPA